MYLPNCDGSVPLLGEYSLKDILNLNIVKASMNTPWGFYAISRPLVRNHLFKAYKNENSTTIHVIPVIQTCR